MSPLSAPQQDVFFEQLQPHGAHVQFNHIQGFSDIPQSEVYYEGDKGYDEMGIKTQYTTEIDNGMFKAEGGHASYRADSVDECTDPKQLIEEGMSDDIQEKEEQKQSITMNVPPTDSGYQSARNLSYFQNIQPPCEKSLCSPTNEHSLGDYKEDFETQTLYSSVITVDASQARNYILELTNHIHGKLHTSIDPKGRNMLSMVLPQLIKAFAFKIYHDNPTQENRNIMYFIHKRHMYIIISLKREGLRLKVALEKLSPYSKECLAMTMTMIQIETVGVWAPCRLLTR